MSSLEALRSLAERLEKAAGPDFGVNFDICHALDTLETGEVIPDYAASIDAALALVERLLPGWYCNLSSYPGTPPNWPYREYERYGSASLNLPDGSSGGGLWTAPTPALAILRALVAALIAKAEHDALLGELAAYKPLIAKEEGNG